MNERMNNKILNNLRKGRSKHLLLYVSNQAAAQMFGILKIHPYF